MKNNRSTLLTNAFFNVFYRTLNLFIPLISSAYLARVLLPNNIGRISLVQTNVSYFILFATLGIPAYGVREIAKCKNDKNEKNKLFSELFVIKCILTILVSSLLFILVSVIPQLKADTYLYYILGLSILLNVINIDWFFQGIEEYAYIAVRSIIVRLTSLLLTLILVNDASDLYIYAFILMFSTSGNYFLNFLHCKKYVKITYKDINIARHFRPLLLLSLCSISTELYAKMDITMLGFMKGNEAVAYYTYAHRIINIIISFLVAVTSVFLPRISFYYENDKAKFNDLVRFGAGVMCHFSIPMSVGLIWVSEPLVTLWLGERFAETAIIVKILSLMIPLKCVGDIVCYQVMLSAKKENILMISYFITMIVNLINNIVLIPAYGVTGAAVASVISEILAFVFVFVNAKRYIILKLNKRNTVVVTVATIIMSITVFLLSMIDLPDLGFMIISVIFGSIIYLLINVMLKNTFIVDIFKRLFNIMKKNR